MNIDEFELAYFRAQECVKKGSRNDILKRIEPLVFQTHDNLVNFHYGEQISALKELYSMLCLTEASSLREVHRYEESLDQCQKALAFGSSPDLFLCIARCFAHLGFIDMAFAYLYRVVPTTESMKASFLEASADLHYQNEETQKAVDLLEQSLDLEFSPDKGYRLATYCIANGDFKRGASLYKHRFDLSRTAVPYPDMHHIPLWSKSLPKGSVLVHWEQGFGDTLMFCRFLEELVPYSNKIYLAVRKPMMRLMEKNFGSFVDVVDADSLPESADSHIPMMDLIGALEKDVFSIKGKPYLKAHKIELESSKKKVGISWQGAPSGAPERNMTLLDFEPILKRKDLELFSFQKGAGLSQASALFQELGIRDLGSTFKDFYDTACALLAMDLFISTDNCLANLAGALGVPTILLLNKIPEYRWMNAAHSTVWYDSVEIIKQEVNGDWSSCARELSRRI